MGLISTELPRRKLVVLFVLALATPPFSQGEHPYEKLNDLFANSAQIRRKQKNVSRQRLHLAYRVKIHFSFDF